LRAGGDYDPMADLEQAFDWVVRTFEPKPRSLQTPRREQPHLVPAGSAPDGSDVVVAVFRADQPIGDVVERISRSL
jgi:hypothetical protein